MLEKIVDRLESEGACTVLLNGARYELEVDCMGDIDIYNPAGDCETIGEQWELEEILEGKEVKLL